jgi:hypothetical protein
MLRSQLANVATLALLFFCIISVSGIPVTSKTGEAPHEPATRELVIAVKSKASKEALDKAFADVSNGAGHYTLHEICNQFGAVEGGVEAVQTWAEEHGGEASATACGDFVTGACRLPLSPLPLREESQLDSS